MDSSRTVERFDAIEAQLAAIVGALRAIVDTMPTEQRSAARSAIDTEIEGLLAGMLNDRSPTMEAAIQGVENLREALIPEH